MTLANALLVSLPLLMSTGGGHASSFATREEHEAYLKKYAYMGSSSPDPRFASITDPDKMFEMAIMKFQMMTGINETGVVDEETVKMMEMPRCGLPDEVGMAMVTKRRRRRYAAHGSRWPRTRLTYRINSYTPDLPQHVTDSEIQTAFKRWSDVSPLTFVKITEKREKVDIDITFGAKSHGDNSPFDGQSGVLAHAFYPRYGGDAHFDEDERWTSNVDAGINLLQVAIHEFGHSLGLAHSSDPDAIMAPTYRRYLPNPQLHTDDIAGIQYIYGSMMSQVQTTRPSELTTPIPLPSTKQMSPSAHAICCDPTVDAIFAVKENVYIFKGTQYYMGRRLSFLLPARQINADWPGLPDNIDTAVYLDGSIVFFKGFQCWRFKGPLRPVDSNPQSISTMFPGLPSKIDAAFVWSGNGRLYFISGNNYYRMSKRPWTGLQYRLDFGYPQPLSAWKGLPSTVDTAFNYTNGRTYFVSGYDFYRFNDVSFQVDSGYPQPTKTYWFGCSDRMESGIKAPGEDMMEKEWMAGGNQFDSASDGIRTYPVLLSTATALGLCLLLLP